MAWAKNGTPDTLSSAGDDLDITDLTANKFQQLLTHTISTGGNIVSRLTFDNITTTSYARRASVNGGADATGTSAANNPLTQTHNDDSFNIIYLVDISGEETLALNFDIERNAAGAGNAPDRLEQVFKFDDTTQFTRVDINNDSGVGSFDTDSNLSAIGTD